MSNLTYEEYLASPWWSARKAAVIRVRGEQCKRCGCRYGLELHHRSYARLGHELPEDVELLCLPCHRREHGLPMTTRTWKGSAHDIERLGEWMRRQ